MNNTSKQLIFTLWMLLLIAASSVPLAGQTHRRGHIVPNGTVYTLLRSGDTTFVGGSFSEAGYYSNRLALIGPGKELPDQDFPMANSDIYAIVDDGSGGWYVGGSFSQIADQQIRYLAHILPDKTVDPNFNPNPNSTVRALLRTDNILYVGGSFTQIAGFSATYLASLDLNNGGQATLWQPQPNSTVYALAYNPTTSIYVGGSFTEIAGKNQRYFAEIRIAEDTLIPTVSVNSTVYDIAVFGNDVYVGGSFSEGGHLASYAAMLGQQNDYPDNRFPVFNSTIERVIPDGNGGWYVGGAFSQVNGQSYARLVHLLPDYSIDPNFVPNPNSTVNDLVLQSGYLYVAGSFTQIAGQAQPYVAKFDVQNNHALQAWNPDPSSTVYSILPMGSQVYLGGNFLTLGGKRQRYFGYVDASTGAMTPTTSVNSTVYAMTSSASTGYVYLGGSFSGGGYYAPYGALMDAGSEVPDNDFPTFNSTINAAVPDGSGGWYIGGSFSNVGGQSKSYLVHILSDNTVDPNFSPSPNSAVQVLLKSGNTLYVGGSFTQLGGQTASRIGAIDATTGQLLAGWVGDPAAANSTVQALALDGSTLYVGGSFTTLAGQPRNYLAAVNATNGSLQPFSPAPNSTVYDLLVDGANLYVGGSFSQITGVSRAYVAAVDKSSGTLVAGFNATCNSTVYSLELDGSNLNVGGGFTQIGGQPRNYLAQISKTTGLATIWNVAANSTVYYFKNGYVAGAFTQLGGQPRRYLGNISGSAVGSWNPDVDGSANVAVFDGTTVMAGGSFSYFRQRNRGYLAAFFPLDNRFTDSWTANANSTVYALERRDADYAYVGGSFTSINSTPRNYIAEIGLTNPGGPTLWNPNASTSVYALEAEADTVYVGGTFTTIGGQARKYLAKLSNTNHATSAVLPWNPQASNTVNSIAKAGSQVVAGGSFTYLKHETRSYLLALDNNSELILPWTPNPNSTIYSLKLDGNRMYVGGIFSQIAGQPRPALTRFRIGAGAADTLDVAWNAAFPTNTTAYVYDIAVSDSVVYAGGLFDVTFANNRPRKYLAAFSKADASLRPWNPRPSYVVESIALADDRILIGGGFQFLQHEQRSNLFAIDETRGRILETWRPDPNSVVYDMELRGGSLFVGGAFTQAGGQPRNYLAEINRTTGAATTWNPNANSSVYDIAWGGNVLYAGGAFTQMKGQARNYIAAFDAGSDVPNAWDPAPSAAVNAIEADDSLVYVGGTFTQIAGQPRRYLASLTPVGQLTDWNPDPNSTVNTIEGNSTTLYVGGSFSNFGAGTQNQRYLASFRKSTGLLRSWDPLINNAVEKISVRDQYVVAGGSFTNGGGLSVGYAAVVSTSSGNALGTFQLASTCRAVFDADSLLYLGGSFTEAEGFPRSRYLAIYAKDFFVGIDEPVSVEALGVRVYPNPTTGALFLSAAQTPVAYSLLSLDGRELLCGEVQGVQPIDLSALADGIYVLHLRADGRMSYGKVVLRR
ncbi:MAG: hypothetical protein OHK0039_01260 [Bacteroidia bacterium]